MKRYQPGTDLRVRLGKLLREPGVDDVEVRLCGAHADAGFHAADGSQVDASTAAGGVGRPPYRAEDLRRERLNRRAKSRRQNTHDRPWIPAERDLPSDNR